MSDETGSALPLVGGLLFIGLFVIALAVDLAVLAGVYRTIAATADLAAEAGAAMIDVDAAHRGETAIDVGRAAAEAIAVVERSGLSRQNVAVDGDEARICVSVTTSQRPAMLAMIGARAVAVSVRSCAEPATG